MSADRLGFIRRAPEIVEAAVRAALREALAERRYHARALDVREFSNLALRQLDRLSQDTNVQADSVGRHELAAAVVRAASRVAASRVARRLFAVPVERLVAAPAGIDAAVFDARRNLHYVRLETFHDDLARLDACRHIGSTTQTSPSTSSSTVSSATSPVASRIGRPSLHFFSLYDGRMRTFPGTVARALGTSSEDDTGRHDGTVTASRSAGAKASAQRTRTKSRSAA